VITDTPRREGPGGRGARERILKAAAKLFYEQGINATGVDRLAEVAEVSKRTLYQHFAGKDELVEAYLRWVVDEGLLVHEVRLARTDLPAREVLLGAFDLGGRGRRRRGCPFLNAAVEIPDAAHPARRLIAAHKGEVRDALAAQARRAGARDPEALADQLAVLLDGAVARSVALGSSTPLAAARDAAAALLDAAQVPAP